MSWCTLALLGCLAACGVGEQTPGEGGDIAPSGPSSNSPTPQGFEELRNEAFALFDQQGSTEQVLAALSRAFDLHREAYGVNLRMARVCSDLRYFAEALQHYELALGQRPAELPIRRELVALAVSLGRDERALELVDPLLEDPAWIGEGTALKARALDDLGRSAEALELLQDAGELPVSGAGPALTLKGRILQEQGDQGAAYECFSAALALAADDQAAVKGLADSSRRLGREPEAERWDEVLELFLALRDNRFTRAAAPASDRKGQRVAGRRSEYIGQEQAAQKERLRRMIEIHPRWPGAWEQLAALQRREGDREGACRTLHELLIHHGKLYNEARQAELLERYCNDD